MTEKEKIKLYLETKGVSKNKFYTNTGLSQGFLDSGNTIGVDKAKIIISNYPDINLNWLVLDEGNMLKDEIPEVAPDKPPDTATALLIDKVVELSTENAKLKAENEALLKELDMRDPYKGKAKYTEAQPRVSVAAEPKLKK